MKTSTPIAPLHVSGLFNLNTIPINVERYFYLYGISCSNRFKKYLLPLVSKELPGMSISEMFIECPNEHISDEILVKQGQVYEDIDACVAAILFSIINYKQHKDSNIVLFDGKPNIRFYQKLKKQKSSFMAMLRFISFLQTKKPLAITLVFQDNEWLIDCYRYGAVKSVYKQTATWLSGAKIFYPASLL